MLLTQQIQPIYAYLRFFQKKKSASHVLFLLLCQVILTWMLDTLDILNATYTLVQEIHVQSSQTASIFLLIQNESYLETNTNKN